MKLENQILADSTLTNQAETPPHNSSLDSAICEERDHLLLVGPRDQFSSARTISIKREYWEENVSMEYLNSLCFPKEIEFTCDAFVGNESVSNNYGVKDESSDSPSSLLYCSSDYLDHIFLKDRLRLFFPREIPEPNLEEEQDSANKYSPVNLVKVKNEPSESVNLETTHLKDGINCDKFTAKLKREHLDCYFESKQSIPTRRFRPRKRRTRKNDSVEKALNEDAPGLLQMLVDNGIVVDEMKLYGEPDESDPNEDFYGLEAVLEKLFLQPDSLLGLPRSLCRTTEKKNKYCLDCLFSLVEQVRSCHFQKWPAIWGWCRDIKSFIFVFNRHNRLIVERPEYGYATYFFELVGLAIDWQIRRLVTVMRFTSGGRVALIENKALRIGENVGEEEAKVLMQFGWKSNSGLGEMVNYCDRVIHDRVSKRLSSEWKSKIVKLLMDGFNGGTLVSSHFHSTKLEPKLKI